MCGRVHISLQDREIKQIIESLPESEQNVQIKFGDVYPSCYVPVITAEKHPIICKWGFGIYGKKGILVNARAETVTEKPTFRNSFLKRRGLLPASGFYEWDCLKNKYYFNRADGKILYLGGFYRQENELNEFIILTKQATPPVNAFHSRIPVIVEPDVKDLYLTDAVFASQYILTENKIKLTPARL